jgi:endonuclease YncB( thermonuclease family)
VRPRRLRLPGRGLPWRIRLPLLLLLALAAGAYALLPGRPDLSGPATVVDGDTIALAGERIRLQGVDAPESGQTCRRNGVAWACGRDSTLALRARLDGRMVGCVSQGRDRYGRVLATCRVDGEDIGAWLVREGLAVAYARYSWRYLPQQAQAWWEGRGLWAGSFEAPEDWRARRR